MKTLNRLLKPLFLWWNWCDILENDEDRMFGAITTEEWAKTADRLYAEREQLKSKQR